MLALKIKLNPKPNHMSCFYFQLYIISFKYVANFLFSIRLFSNALEHLHTTTHTLILTYTESSFSHKNSNVLVTWLRSRG
jgi:hypothetical protein